MLTIIALAKKVLPKLLGVMGLVTPVITGGFKKMDKKTIKKLLPYAAVLVAIVVVIYFLQKKKEKETFAEINEKDDIDHKAMALADLLATYLNTKKIFGKLDPRSWLLQNDRAAYKLLKENLEVFEALEFEYNKISRSGSLKIDLEKRLDNKYRKKLIPLLYG